MSSTGDIYGTRRNGRSHGDVFTSPDVVKFMLDLIGYTSDKNLSEVRILEPSCGEGDFVLEIQQRIIESANRFGFNAADVFSSNVYVCELDAEKLEVCKSKLVNILPDVSFDNFKRDDFLSSSWHVNFDFIIGNPPYVRYENIPEEKRRAYKQCFLTFHYRCDIYVLFFEHCLKFLADNGKHCFICSNRWLKNEYGKKLRNLISCSYSLDYLIDAEGINAFKEDVLAYPSITVISNSHQSGTIKTMRFSSLDEIHKNIPYKTISSDNNNFWDRLFSDYELDNYQTLNQQGYTIGIGVASGADKVFISSDFDGLVEKELLMPIINSKDLTGNKFLWHGQYLLNPYMRNGDIINLEEYPKAKQYLESHRLQLEKRHIVKNKRVWFSLIDKVKEDLLHRPKILLPDISGNRILFVDKGDFYPAHNIYYIIGGSYSDLVIVACVLMSSFIKKQLENVSNKMNGGFPRWQSQAIKKLRLPLIKDIDSNDRAILMQAYDSRDYEMIEAIVSKIIKEAKVKTNTPMSRIPKSLFDYTF